MSLLLSKIAPPLSVVAAGMAAGSMANKDLGLSPELSNALTAFIIAIGGVLLRWFEKKVLKLEAKKKEEYITELQNEIQNLKRTS